MFDTPMREIPFYKRGGKVSLINKSIVKKKKMKQKQTQKQIVNIYNTAKPTTRKRTYKKVEKKEEQQQQRMPVYYTQPQQYTQYLPAPTITMPTRLPTMTPEAKLPTLAGLTTGLKTTKETKETGTEPDFDADFNDYMNDKQIYEQEQEEIKRKNKEFVDFLINNNNNYQDEALPNFNYGKERLPPPPPPRPPQQETKEPSEFNEYPDEKNDYLDDYKDPSEFDEYEEPPIQELEQLSLNSDLPNNKSYSKWTFEQLQRATINNGLYNKTTEPKKGQQKFDDYGNIVKRGEPGYEQATRQKTRKELIDALNEYDRLKIN